MPACTFCLEPLLHQSPVEQSSKCFQKDPKLIATLRSKSNSCRQSPKGATFSRYCCADVPRGILLLNSHWLEPHGCSIGLKSEVQHRHIGRDACQGFNFNMCPNDVCRDIILVSYVNCVLYDICCFIAKVHTFSIFIIPKKDRHSAL